MSFISIVPYNRELLVIADMDVFTSFFCYAKKQKMGLVPPGRSTDAGDGDPSLFDPVEYSEDADLLPVTNIGFRN